MEEILRRIIHKKNLSIQIKWSRVEWINYKTNCFTEENSDNIVLSHFISLVEEEEKNSGYNQPWRRGRKGYGEAENPSLQNRLHLLYMGFLIF